MAAKKSAAQPPASPLRTRAVRLLGLLAGPGRPWFLGLLLAAGLFLAWLAVWRQVEADLLSSADYWLTYEKVDVSPPPRWIHRDIRAEVFRDAGFDGAVSIMDEALTERIARAFALHPWVEAVHRVVKHHPARVSVELSYRRPVLMVKVPGGWYPVDAKGILLPTGDFSSVEASRYPRLLGIETIPVSTAGERWGDARVVAAAEIVTAFGETWDALGLREIVPLAADDFVQPSQHTFALYTRGGTQVLWGRTLGMEPPGEATASEKIATLVQFHQQTGSLDGDEGPQQIDVRFP